MTRARDVAESSLYHIKTETFSAASTVSLNNVFSADYDNYLIKLNLTAATSNNADVTLKFRASGTDTSANYNTVRIYANTGSGPVRGGNPAGTDEIWILNTYTTNTTRNVANMELFNPQNAEITGAIIHSVASFGDTYESNWVLGNQTTATSFDGFTLLVSAGTISGTLRVYGYRD